MTKSQKSHDFELAYKLQQQEQCFGLTENAVLTNNEHYTPRTLIDQTLELIDPTPNIHTLFVQFNQRFFWNVLMPVEVKWSSRMTSCAGICSFQYRSRQCVITLSEPLLKLRPRKDVVETLLHEMIHGYLFLTNNNHDRDGHGSEFCKHMDRINRVAGTKITIYHSFHDEVRLYQQHWWRCNGLCQKRAPYFGTVRRAMNRAPGTSDFWWKEHQRTCGGQFVKIKEPENFKAKSSKNKEKIHIPPKYNNSPNNTFTWLTKATSPIRELKPESTAKNSKGLTHNQKSLNEFIRIGNNTSVIPAVNMRWPGSSKNSKKEDSSGVNPKKNNFPLIMPKLASTPKQGKSVSNIQSCLNGLIKLGNGKNNVHGWGTGGPCSSTNSTTISSHQIISTTPKVSSSGVLGGSNNGRSNLVDKLYIDNNRSQNFNKNIMALEETNSIMNIAMIGQPVANKEQSSNEIQIKLVECPICCNFVPNEDVNNHVDSCLVTNNEMLDSSGRGISTKSYDTIHYTKVEKGINNSPRSKKRTKNNNLLLNKQSKLNTLQRSKKTYCPVCNNRFDFENITEHLDVCLSNINKDNNTIIELDDAKQSMNDSIIPVNSTSTNLSSSQNTGNSKTSYSSIIFEKPDAHNDMSHNCLICNELIPPGTALNDHLEDCIGNVFNESLSLSIDDDNVETSNMNLEISAADNKYPCPVCMQLVAESAMNEHLDACLSDT